MSERTTGATEKQMAEAARTMFEVHGASHDDTDEYYDEIVTEVAAYLVTPTERIVSVDDLATVLALVNRVRELKAWQQESIDRMRELVK